MQKRQPGVHETVLVPVAEVRFEQLALGAGLRELRGNHDHVREHLARVVYPLGEHPFKHRRARSTGARRGGLAMLRAGR